MTGLGVAEPAYVTVGKRAQALLDEGRAPEAVAELEAGLEDPAAEAGYGRAVLLERLGTALLRAGAPDQAVGRLREALEHAGRLAPTHDVRRFRATVRSGLGDALRRAGRMDDARRAYLAALEIARELRDPRSEGVDQARLGALALAQGDAVEALERYQHSLAALRQLKEPAVEAVAWQQLGRVHQRLGAHDEAERHYREALRLHQAGSDLGAADRALGDLIGLQHEAGRPDLAERWCRRAVELLEPAGPSLPLARRLLGLGALLAPRGDARDEARRVAVRALTVAQQVSPAAPEAWAAYGLLGELNPSRGDLAELARRAPAIVAALATAGARPGFARAVLLGRLGRCFEAGARSDLAASQLQEAVRVARALPPSAHAADLLAMLTTDLARLLGPGDTGSAGPEDARHPLPGGGGPLVTVLEHATTDYAFEPNLLLDGPRSPRLWPEPEQPLALADDARPVLVPGTRTWLDAEGRIRIVPPADEPQVEMVDGCTVMRRAARDVAVHAEHPLVWGLLAAMDGRTAWRGIREDLVDPERGIVQGVTSALVAAGAVDLSGRALGRFLHWATRKGVAPAGGLEGDEALRLASDGETGRAAGRARLPMSAVVPAPLREFHALTRARRSIRDYRGTAIPRDQLDALIGTACGVTGALRWPGGEVKLRAYPSSGALYAVGVYPVALRVEDLDSSVLRLDADAGALEVIGPTDPAHWIAAALPMERELVAGLSLLVCLTGRFDRHERKYGEGGYRMLVAEAGHVSHNLVLAATALGLAARPFGGMFDALVNDALGLDEATEQFLLAVAVGHAG